MSVGSVGAIFVYRGWVKINKSEDENSDGGGAHQKRNESLALCVVTLRVIILNAPIPVDWGQVSCLHQRIHNVRLLDEWYGLRRRIPQ